MSSTTFDAVARLGFEGAWQAQTHADNESEQQFSSVDAAKIIAVTEEKLSELASLQRKQRITEREESRQYTKAKKAASQKGATPSKIIKSYAISKRLSRETAAEIAEACFAAAESPYMQNRSIVNKINEALIYGRADQYELEEIRDAAHEQMKEHRPEELRVVREKIVRVEKELAELGAKRAALDAKKAAFYAEEAAFEAEEAQPEPATYQLGGLAFRPR